MNKKNKKNPKTPKRAFQLSAKNLFFLGGGGPKFPFFDNLAQQTRPHKTL